MNSPNNAKFKLKKELFEQVLLRLDKVLQEPESEYIRDAAIQRFEFTYELAWETLQAYLSLMDLIVLSPKETLKVAHEQGLIFDASAWSELHQQRNLTSHTYDQKLAESVYDYLKLQGLQLFIELKDMLNRKC